MVGVLVGRSPWTARDAPVPLPDAEAGASARARAAALHDFAGDVWLSQVDTHLQPFASFVLAEPISIDAVD